ncbi:MAG: class I SAM-dependent methyltransferase family protein [Thermoplasmata archaeon]|nr:MAG: class I SAM-dependent methyltransferase family protein [Thermoplasmata archaeon]
MRVVRVRRQDVDEALGRLLAADVVERGLKVSRRGDHALIPVLVDPPASVLAGIEHQVGEVDVEDLAPRERLRTPLERVARDAREAGWTDEEVEALPDRWERLGRLVLLRVPRALEPKEEEMAGLYARVLRVDAVLAEEGPVTGIERRPTVRPIWGEGTVTVHREHGVEYEFDAARQMFSKGNVGERLRMGRTVRDGEVVVDMFAGIGYFSLPMAVMGSPAAVHAVEIDEEAHRWLERNVTRNGVEDVVRPRLGDCRDVAPRGVADRVVMGYVGGTEEFLDVAMEVLGTGGGVVHLHEKYGIEEVPDRPLEAVRGAAGAAGREARLLSWREVKSYAPAIVHAVVDVDVQ